VARVLQDGCDVVSFSCDKLLGGPQAGVLCGRRELIDKLKKHPLVRALRPDKLTLLALSATLELYRDEKTAEVPVLRMLAEGEATLRGRAERLLRSCQGHGEDLPVSLWPVRSAVGGGSLPLGRPRSYAVGLSGEHASPARMEAALRRGRPAVLCRIAEDRLLLDVRTIADSEVAATGAALCAAYKKVRTATPEVRNADPVTEGETRA
jgi:L-seryl-tRNA(Ser) seleniumtransferase